AVFREHTAAVVALAFTKDGRVASGDQSGATIMWDPQTLRVERKLGLPPPDVGPGEWPITDAPRAWSPDGRLLVAGGGDIFQARDLRLWDTGRLVVRATLTGHSQGVISVSFSTDGRTVVTTAFDGTARLWDASTGKELAAFTVGFGLPAAALSPDGR